MNALPQKIVSLPALTDKTDVFRDREHAGQVLAGMLAPFKGSDTVIMAIPAGGVEVGASMARALGLKLAVAVVSKITLPMNTEVGYGAVAFDGTVLLDQAMIDREGLSEDDVRRGIEKTREKIKRRIALGKLGTSEIDWKNFTTVLVDDGIASGITMKVAIQAMRNQGVRSLVIAVPTAHSTSVREIAPSVDTIYCANLRHGFSFAVADAYQQWRDVGEEELARLLEPFTD